MPKRLPAADVTNLLGPGKRVYVQGATGESAAFADALRNRPDACSGVHFLGVWLPGINHVDYAGIHPEATATAFFVGRELRESHAARRIGLLPVSYFEAFGFLKERGAVDVAFVQVAAPDREGRMSLGVCHDFAPAVLPAARLRVAHINPSMPPTNGLRLAPDQVEYIIEDDRPLLRDRPVDDEMWRAIGAQVATLIRDGDTIEVGIGQVQSVLHALTGLRKLRVHAGIVTSAMLPLVESGALDGGEGAVTTGCALGEDTLYEFVGRERSVRFAAVGHTHDLDTLRQIRRFIAINTVIEVDLFGQANAEMAGRRQVSGAGGLMDFIRGARASAGGRSVIALPSTGRNGAVSRIVPELSAGTAVSVARNDMDVVVTEHGIAELRWKSLDERAEALCAIAAPAFRDGLAAAWQERRRRM
jgi:acyl-CoA hydrolase